MLTFLKRVWAAMLEEVDRARPLFDWADCRDEENRQ